MAGKLIIEGVERLRAILGSDAAIEVQGHDHQG